MKPRNRISSAARARLAREIFTLGETDVTEAEVTPYLADLLQPPQVAELEMRLKKDPAAWATVCEQKRACEAYFLSESPAPAQGNASARSEDDVNEVPDYPVAAEPAAAPAAGHRRASQPALGEAPCLSASSDERIQCLAEILESYRADPGRSLPAHMREWYSSAGYGGGSRLFGANLGDEERARLAEWLRSADTRGEGLLESFSMLPPFSAWPEFQDIRHAASIRGILLRRDGRGGYPIQILVHWRRSADAEELEREAVATAEDSGFKWDNIEKVQRETRPFLRSKLTALALVARCPWRAATGWMRLRLLAATVAPLFVVLATAALAILCAGSPDAMPSLAKAYQLLAGAALFAGLLQKSLISLH